MAVSLLYETSQTSFYCVVLQKPFNYHYFKVTQPKIYFLISPNLIKYYIEFGPCILKLHCTAIIHLHLKRQTIYRSNTAEKARTPRYWILKRDNPRTSVVPRINPWRMHIPGTQPWFSTWFWVLPYFLYVTHVFFAEGKKILGREKKKVAANATRITKRFWKQ